MGIIERIKGMLLAPKAEWPRVAAEPMTTQGIYTGWVLILAAIGPLAMLPRFGLGAAITQYVITLAMTAVIALVVDFLAPKFGGTGDFVAALKLSAFSYTAAFVAGAANLLGMLGFPVLLLASVYAWYTFYLGAPVLRKCSPDKAIAFTAVIVVSGILIVILFSMFASGAGFVPRY
jgi:hypothetical protein